MSTDDPWLDAFDLDDLDNPDLEAVDDAVARLKQHVVPTAGPRRSSTWLWAGLAAALAAGALLGVGWSQLWQRDASSVAAAPPAPTAPLPTPRPTPPPLPQPVPDVPPTAPPGASAEPVIAENHAPVPAPALQPGLQPHPRATVHVQGQTAVLVRGTLRYVHDAAHDPGVSQVRWEGLPLVATPVGTAFTVASEGSLAALAVSEGEVQLAHTDGRRLASLGPGQEVVVIGDLQHPTGLRVLEIDGAPLDRIGDRVGEALASRELVSVVASLRLHAVGRPLRLPHEP